MARRSIKSRVKSRVSRARKTVKRKVSRVRKTVKRRVATVRKTVKRKATRRRITKRIKTLKTPKKRTVKKSKKLSKKTTSRVYASIRRTGKISKKIRSSKKPATQVKKTGLVSSLFARAREKVKAGVSRAGKVAENKPAIFDLKGWQAKNRSWLAGKTTGLKEWQAGNRANLKEKVGFVKIGIGAVTGKLGTSAGAAYEATKDKTAGVVQWFKDKAEDVTEAATGAVESVAGAAEDFKAKRERKSLIRKIVLALVLLFLGLLLWKKAK